jgi:hypothetical protein
MPEIVIGRDEEDLQTYGQEGTIFIGKHMVGSGEEAHTTTPILLDVLRPHIFTLTGKRGCGKSYSMGVFIEELTKLPDKIRKNLCAFVVDTQGIFWTMKSPSEKDFTMLGQWGLKPKGFDVYVYVPEGQVKLFSNAGVEFDDSFSFMASELAVEDWINVFEFDLNDTIAILLQKAISMLRNEKENFMIDDIIDTIKKQDGFEKEKLNLENHFLAAHDWGIFGEAKTPKILEPGKVSILDVSLTPQSVRALLVALISRKIYSERVAARRKEETAEIEMTSIKRVPMPWIFIDEAHNFLPDTGTTAAMEILLKIVKEGRQPGITLVFATQRPEKLHPDALAQCDMIISHRLTAKADIEALKSIMQTYMLFDIGKYINELPKLKGVAIILDDNSERIYKALIRPRQSWHAGSSPVAI